jgi:hypothetical protein
MKSCVGAGVEETASSGSCGGLNSAFAAGGSGSGAVQFATEELATSEWLYSITGFSATTLAFVVGAGLGGGAGLGSFLTLAACELMLPIGAGNSSNSGVPDSAALAGLDGGSIADTGLSGGVTAAVSWEAGGLTAGGNAVD